MKFYTLLFSFSILFFSCESSLEPIEEVNEDETIEVEEVSAFESAEEMKMAIERGNVKYDFYANFTEPFFTIYIVDRQALVVRMDGVDEMYEILMGFNPTAGKQEIIIGEVTAKILKEKGSDGMSDLNYPYSVEYGEFVGGGATERVLEE